MKQITLFLLGSILPLAVFAQKGPSGNTKNNVVDRSPLYAHSWNLVELNGLSTLQPGIPQAYITFKPGDDEYNRIAGFTGCNYIIGRIDLQGEDEIAFTPDLITSNNCAGSSVESPLLETLAAVDRWTEKDGQLLLYRKGKVVAKWNPSAYSNKNLNGIWQLYYVRNHSEPFAEIFPVTNRPSMIFSFTENMVSGYTGCHEFSTPVMINNNSMVFANHYVVQDTTCTGDGEFIFLTNLVKVTAYGFKDDKTLVMIANNEPVMAFTRTK